MRWVSLYLMLLKRFLSASSTIWVLGFVSTVQVLPTVLNGAFYRTKKLCYRKDDRAMRAI